MNETLVKEIVQLIMSNPDLMQQLLINKPVVNEKARPEILILLNYVPNLTAILDKLSVQWENDYRVSVLGTDAVMKEQLVLPAAMKWVSCTEAIKQWGWQKIILPACSANTLAKIALGIRDTAVCELAGRAIAEGIPVELDADYLGLTPQTSLAYRRLYAGYIERLRQYGVTIKAQPNNCAVLEESLNTETINFHGMMMPQQNQTAPQVCTSPSDYTKADVICWEGKLMTEQDTVNLPEQSVIKIAKKAIISPLAKDKLRQRNIQIVREMEV